MTEITGHLTKVFLVISLVPYASLHRVWAQEHSAPPSVAAHTGAALQVSEVMQRALGRCYSVAHGETPDGRVEKGVTRISWVPPTKKDYAVIAKLGEEAVPELAAYITPAAIAMRGYGGGLKQLLAVKFLASVGTPSTVAPLGAALNPDDWEVARLNALDALGAMPGPESTSMIRSVLGDSDPMISERAKQILALRHEQSPR